MLRESGVNENSAAENLWEYDDKPDNTNHDDSLEELIQEVIKVITPAWPLQSAAAVNPFWNFKDKPFEDLLIGMEPSLGCNLLLPLGEYLSKLEAMHIDPEVLKEVHSQHGQEGEAYGYFISKAKSVGKSSTSHFIPSLVEFSYDSKVDDLVRNDLFKYLMAYFDKRQSLVPVKEGKSSFWEYWLEGLEYDEALHYIGFAGFNEAINKLRGLNHLEAIEYVLSHLGFKDQGSKFLYMQTLISRTLGWGSKFAFQVWQKSIGYKVEVYGKVEELLAVSLAYEYGIAQCKKISSQKYLEVFKRKKSDQDHWVDYARGVFQKSWEYSMQLRTVSKLNSSKPASEKPWCSMVFCIDVRSEMARRAIENHIPTVKTVGFAGFFGLPTDFKLPNYREAANHLPVLLSPAYKSRIEKQDKGLKANYLLSKSFMKHVRKMPYSSFFYVELFGLVSAWQLIRDTFASFFKKLNLRNTIDTQVIDNKIDITNINGTQVDQSEVVKQCAAVLKHMGCAEDFPEVFILVGHTSKCSNNAFQSGLKCGACGGNGSDVNAKIMTDILNDPEIRKGIATQGVNIPESTVFFPAVHETVSDEVFLFPYKHLDAPVAKKLEKLEGDLKAASKAAREDRSATKSNVTRLSSENTRAFNWSEVRPEWGLAGNHSFVVAPRWRTKGQDHESRIFLHDYDWQKDEGFTTLEMIMTAPMVVTNWINMHYYAPTVAPSKYSSGSKTLHNIFGESGVLQGNSSDLKIGLPLESIHDGEQFVHEPLRLSVYIEAPQTAIDDIIAKHEMVRDLVDNKWLYIIRIDSEEGKCFLRKSHGKYEQLRAQLACRCSEI